ncbi:MAG: hypothetical protein ABSH50_25675 [Bryobacteraceae bacterium]|jgi:hypothetical protein
MTFSQLNCLCDEILQSDSDRSHLLASFSDLELQRAYVDTLRQFGVELAVGIEANSNWILPEVLMIGGNPGPIHACQAAFEAIRLEMSRRKVDPPNVALGCR